MSTTGRKKEKYFLFILLFFLSVTHSKRITWPPSVGIADLQGYNGCGYSAALDIEGEEFYVLVDSGSSNLAIATRRCSCAGVSPVYNGSLVESSSLSIQYGSGSLSGKVIENLDFNATSNLQITSMNLMGITAEDTFFQCGNLNQGILGLAYPYLSVGNLPILPTVLNTEANVPDGFALQLCAFLPGMENANKTGNMWYGGYDSSFVSGQMKYMKVVNKEWFNIQINSVSMGGSRISLPDSLNSPLSLVDSGTTQILVNTQNNYDAILEVFISSDMMIWDPSVSPTDIVYFWAGYITIPSGYYTVNTSYEFSFWIKSSDGVSEMRWKVDAINFLTIFNDGSVAFTGLAMDWFGGGTIIGMTAFVGKVVFFDRGTGRIGVADGVNCSAPLSEEGIDVFTLGVGPCNSTVIGQCSIGCLQSNKCLQLQCTVGCYVDQGCPSVYQGNCTTIAATLPGCHVDCSLGIRQSCVSFTFLLFILYLLNKIC